ncbi:MAG: BON domain-containing protein [Fimbriimonas sp.]
MKTTSWLQGIALGAGLMYLFDPAQGKRRRNMMRDQAIHQARVKQRSLRVMQRDFANRSQGLVHEVQGRFQPQSADDVVIVDRVRSAMGRCCSHTHGISVGCTDGMVTLSGPVTANEVVDLIGTVKNVKGVTRVINNLDVHSSSDGTSQSYAKVNRWAPGECLVAVTAGAILTLYGLGRRGVSGWLMGFGGATLIAKGFRDTEHRFEGGHSSQAQIASPSSSIETAPV